MSITVLLELQSAPEAMTQVQAFLARILPDTRAYAGFEQIRTLPDPDQPGTIVVIERWRGLAEYRAYLEWRMRSGVMAELAAMLTVPPEPLILAPVT